MEVFFGVIGVASFAYFVLILLYNGLTSFLWFWPCFAVVNILLLAFVRLLKVRKRKKQDIPLAPVVFVFASYAWWMAVLLLTLMLIFFNARTTNEKDLDYVIVLGTDLQNNRISPSLRARLDRAVEYHKENPSTIFVLSGGHGSYNTSTEASVMYFYMIQHGVPPKQLLMEFYSDSTQEKVGYSIQTILTDRQERITDSRYEKGKAIGDTSSRFPSPEDAISADDRPLRVGILTSEFNLFRATRMAERYGIEHAYPIGTKSDELMLVHLSVREAVAIVKDRLVGNI